MDADERIAQLTQTLEEVLDQGEVTARSLLTSLLSATIETMQATESSVFRPDGEEQLRFYASTNENLVDNPDIKPIPIGSSIAGFVYITGQTIAREDAGEAKGHYGAIDKVMGYKTAEYMAAPVVSGDTVLGVMSVVNRREESGLGKFNEDELALAEQLGRACGVIINHVDRIERQTEASRQALRDSVSPASEGAALRASIDARLSELSDMDLELIHDLTARLSGGSSQDEY